jgi:hypothetical protein
MTEQTAVRVHLTSGATFELALDSGELAALMDLMGSDEHDGDDRPFKITAPRTGRDTGFVTLLVAHVVAIEPAAVRQPRTGPTPRPA